jgi:hypothetical protein
MKKGEVAATLLEIIRDGAVDITALTLAVLNAGYGASVRKIESEKNKIYDSILDMGTTENERHKLKHRLSSYLHSLKRQGFIEKKGRLFLITKKGYAKLGGLKNSKLKSFPVMEYPRAKAKAWVLIAFDVPEKEKRKRNWLRKVIVNLGFTSIQKSFYVGRVKIPDKFIADLSKLNLLPYIEIFEITKKGTLERTAVVN